VCKSGTYVTGLLHFKVRLDRHTHTLSETSSTSAFRGVVIIPGEKTPYPWEQHTNRHGGASPLIMKQRRREPGDIHTNSHEGHGYRQHRAPTWVNRKYADIVCVYIYIYIYTHIHMEGSHPCRLLVRSCLWADRAKQSAKRSCGV